MIGVIFVASVPAGLLSFFLAGGISSLASDVGINGAWTLAIFIQFTYAALSVIGFSIFSIAARKFEFLTPTTLPVIIGTVIIAACINLYGIYRTGAGMEFIRFGAIVIALSAAIYFFTTLALNGLTNHFIGRLRRH